MRVTSCLFLIAVFGSSTVALAQFPYPAPYFTGPGSYRHASTVEEGAQRGLADVIRSKGAANLMNSEAAKNYEDARRKRIDNRMHATQTWFQMRDFNRQARAAERGPRPTQQDLIRLAESNKPRRLSTSDLDPLSGDISWPVLLRDDQFRTDREKLEQLYDQRAKNGYLTPDQFLEIDQVSKKMLGDLKKNIRQYPPQSYTQAKGFLTSLHYESYLAPG